MLLASWHIPTDSVNVAGQGPSLTHWDVSSATDGLEISAYLGNARAAVDTQDALVVCRDGERMVLGVADGVTPTSRTPDVEGSDGARFAALHVLKQVSVARSTVGLDELFRDVNNTLYARFGDLLSADLSARDLPQAAAAAVEVVVLPDGSVKRIAAVRAGDCDIWWRRGTVWTREYQQQMLVGEVRQWLAIYDMSNPGASCDERVLEETRWLNDAAYWNTTALGRFSNAKIEHFDVPPDVDELVVATDGARFEHFVERGGRDLAGWMRQLRMWERARSSDAPRHDDVALLSLDLAADAAQSAGTSYLNT